MSAARRGRLVDAALLDACEELLSRELPLVDEVEKPVLVHRDLGPRNLLIDDPSGALRILDCEAAMGGDPAEDLRWIAIAGADSPAVGAFLDGYGRRQPHTFGRRVRFHGVVCALDVFGYAGRFNPSLLSAAITGASAAVSG